MDMDLTGKRAMVCGSTQGIGRAAATELALLGASVTLVARDENALKKVRSELDSSKKQNHDYLCVDFNFPAEVQVAAERYVEEKDIVHILVNNTGGPPAGLAIDTKPDEFVKAFYAHLVCNQILVQTVVEGMKKEKYGRIINIISTSVKQPIKGLGVSNTIRAAVANWGKTLSMEMGRFGITVNNVLPGYTDTGRLQSLIELKAKNSGKKVQELKKEMMEEIPLGRFATPKEVAAAIAFLASPAASCINGINLPVDGGRTGSL
jgi:3-oxoacyl-[acyl-carrier protein] reductase